MAKAQQISITEGSTATAILCFDNDLYVAYVGDSAAILVQRKDFINLTHELDLAEENIEERNRIDSSGGIIMRAGNTFRVQGELALTRSLGAIKYKPHVVSKPHQLCHTLEEKDSFVVLASDGLWKVMSKEEVAGIVRTYRELPENEIVRNLYAAALSKDLKDNTTIAVINLEKREKLRKERMLV